MKLKTLVSVLALVGLMAVANTASARLVHDFSCDLCHKPNMVLDDVSQVICLDCHTAGHEAETQPLYRTAPGITGPIGNAVFDKGDASDALGASTAQGVTPVEQNSHSWGASDTNPAAGATAPVDALFYGRSNYSGATVSCGRCHDPHGTLTDDRGVGTANPQLLKLGAGSTDAMCVDCHTSWNATNADAYLTHPLVKNYATFQAANPTKYKPFAPSATSGMTLDVNGDIACTTCHGVHFTDSSATTTDGMGQALDPGDGYMLKGNGRMTGDASSICQNCHVYQGHGAGKIGCINCHSGHSYNNGIPNFFVLRDDVASKYSGIYPASAPANPGTNLMYTSATYPWKNAGNGYCEKCHTLASDHNGLTTGGSTPAECGQCHKHDDSVAAFTAGVCDQCHGNPPADDSKGAGTLGTTSTGRAFDPLTGWDYSNAAQNSFIKSEIVSPHTKHAGSAAGQYGISCGDCHNGNTHKSGTFQDVFNTPISKVTSNGQLATSYAPAGNGTCAAVYCHSNGGPRSAIPTAVTGLTWQNGTAKSCASCHGNDAVSMSSKGNSAVHQGHLGAATSLLGKTFNCAVCHKDTATNSTTLVTAAVGTNAPHVNAAKDVVSSMAASGLASTPLDFTYDGTIAGTCSAVYCHSDGLGNYKTPDWDGGSVSCTFCHNNGTDDGNIVNAAPATGAHAKHVVDTDGPKLSCNSCHTHNGTTGTTGDHIDGFVSVITNVQTSVCNVCHAVDAGETAPIWTTAGSDDCITCHTGTTLSTIGTQAPDKTLALTKGHNLPLTSTYTVSNNPGANKTCEDCHDKTATHLTGTGNKRLKATFDCATCHTTITTHQSKACLTCHDPHGNANIYMVKPTSADYSGTVAFRALTGNNSFDEADSNNADDVCATCHTSTNQTLQHNNKENIGTHAAGNKQGQNCFDCHKPHTDPLNAFAVGAGTSCDGCHGFPPANAAHAVHNITSGNTNAEDRTDCAVCHTGADSYTYAGTGDQPGLNHGDAAGRMTILTNPAGLGYNSTDKTCANACHTSTVGNGGIWSAATTLACDACHYYELAPTSANNTAAGVKALTGTHNAHFDAGKTCTDCHAAVTDLTHNTVALTGTDLAKIQGLAVATQDEATILGTVGTDNDPGNPNCNNAACHNPSGTSYSADWNGPAATCDTCHSSTDPATNNHTAHLNTAATFGVTIACTDCHADNGVNMAHLDGTVDVTGTKVTAFTSPNCTNSCHQDGRTGAAAVTATWGMAAQANCTICHIQQPATGSHAKHLAVSGGATCADCHDTTVDNTTAASQHLDLNVDAFKSVPADLGYPADKALNTAFTTCNAAACHSDGRGTLVTTPVWGTNSACTECHAAAPATGSHSAHLVNPITAIACTDCHAGAVQGTTEPTIGHRDANVDTNATLGYTQNKGIASPYETCGTASCHDNGLGVVVATPVWGTPVTDCSECHLKRPGTGSHTNHLNAVKDPAVSATTKIACTDCHTGAVEGLTKPTTGHFDGNVDVANGYPLNVAKGNGTWSTCTAASCHNNGQSGLDADAGNVAGVVVTTPQWGTTATCSACHVAVPTSAKHDEHLGSYSATCGDCHDGATQNVSGGNNHRNGNIDVRAALNYDKAGAPGNGWGTCTNPAGLAGACHGTANARNWDATAGAACNVCHGASGATGAPLITGDMISTNPLGQHSTHVTTLGYSCNICHNGHGMPTTDDKITMAFTGQAAGGTYNPPATWTAGKWLYTQTSTTTTQDCSTLYCHSNGQANGGGAGALTYATPDWGNATSAQCGTCHAGDGASGNMTTIASGSHTKHIADGATCNTCHSGNIHVNQSIEVTSVTYTAAGAPGNGYGTCSTASCHDNGTGVQVVTPTWGNTAAACSACHAAVPASGSHTKHLALSGVSCGNCHTGAVVNVNGGANHRDTNIDTVPALGYPQAKIKGSAYASCATASCHTDGLGNAVASPVWGSSAPNCTACHAAAPTTGSHSTHFTDGAACNVCHDGAVESTTASTNHLSGAVNIDALPTNTYANDPAAIGTGSWTTCSTASCHTTGQAATAYAVTPVWGVNAPNCTQCHEASPTTGSHAKHIANTGDCATCHTGAVINTSYVSASHRDNNIDVAVGGYTVDRALGGTKESCANISCHSDGLTATTGTSPVWGTATPNCTACHAAAPATGSHGVHLGAERIIGTPIVCADCHNDAVISLTPPTGVHTNNNVDVFNSTAGDLGYPITAAIGNASWSTCSAASCHDNGTGALVTTPTWGTPSTCNECHLSTPTSGSHGTHLGLSGVSCGTCHDGAVVNSDGGLNHRDLNIDTVAALGYPQNKTKGSAYASCATASCHNNGLGVAVASPVWGGTSTCNSCHTTPPATGSHSKHLTNTEAGSISCGNCHSDATPTVSATGVHANNNVDVFDAVSGDLGYPTTAALGTASWSTCNNASCHTNGTGTKVTTPTWGAASAACTACHAAAPTTGAHTKHLNAVANGMIGSLNCTNCHSDASQGVSAPSTGHRDGNLDVYNSAAGDLGYAANVTSSAPSYNTYTCNTSYCHGDAMPKGSISGTTNAPTWSMTSTGCTFCHAMAPASIGAHAGKVATDCISCHDNVNAAGTGFVDPSLHIDGTLQGGGDNCFDCHANIGSGLSGAHATHVTQAYVGKLSTNDYGNNANGWNSYTNTGGVYNIGCGYCHPSDVAGHMTLPTASTRVSLNPGDLNAGLLKTKNDASANYDGTGAGSGKCSAVYCHSDGTAANLVNGQSLDWFTGASTGTCGDCHGNTPTSNAHSVHTVGIHYTDLYDSDRNGLMQAAAATNAAHGDIATSTTITCVICHGATVTLTQNDQNDVCTTCHSGATTKGNLGIAAGSVTHINGQPDVLFNMTGFKSKAQLRDDITTVTELNNSWTRTNGYKQVAGTSHDVSKGTAAFSAGTCSAIACHNGNSASWSDPVAGNCQKCHTALPQ